MLDNLLPWGIDLTEVEPFDDLHHPEGLLKRSQEAAAAVFGAKQSYYLVNGSTCGLLAAICSLKGGSVIVSRNCHKAVFHGIELSGAMPVIIDTELDGNGIYGPVTPEGVLEAVSENPEAAAVIITSPTYEGVISDIKGILSVLKPFGIPLIVDEAHGPHLGFCDYFPESSARLGADVVIQSLHKTLPALTQSAILHLNSELIDRRELERQLRIFQTSSPSYVLMASMDYCVRGLAENSMNWFSDYAKRLEAFYALARGLKRLKLFDSGLRDKSKIVLLPGTSGLTGFELAERLLNLGVQCEMSALGYSILMTSICDTDENFTRTSEAIFAIDSEETAVCKSNMLYTSLCKPLQVVSPREAMLSDTEMVDIGQCGGRVCAEYIMAYPPGVPLVIPGQQLDESALLGIERAKAAGVNLRGTFMEAGKLRVIKQIV